MIIGNALEIGIQLEHLVSLRSPSGLFNFIIDDNLIPGKGVVTDLYVVISSLKESLSSHLKENTHDIGNVKLEDLDFSNGAPENIIWLDCGELSDYGCVFWLGFDGERDRFFYSTDYEKTIIENSYPRGTIENLINGLPDAEKLRINKINNIITITDLAI